MCGTNKIYVSRHIVHFIMKRSGAVMTPIDFDKAKLEPATVFKSPADVLLAADLTHDQKIEILQSWEYQAADEAVALEEGMPGDDSDLLWQVLDALGRLTGPLDLEHTAPNKQHGLSIDALRKVK